MLSMRKLRWCRHDGLPVSHWTQLLDFAKRVIRPCAIPHLTVDNALVRAEASRKKRRAATGLDGVSRDDLVQADQATLLSLTKVYSRAEADGEWPAQMLAGKVQSLAKTDSAATVGDYRPITIFGLPYRLWSSLQSRHLLQFADSWVDDSVFGNRRGRQASDLWSQLLIQIDEAYASNTALSGVSADLEKCFNCIPRFPALCLAVLVGTPAEVTTAWSGALVSMRRHFKIRDSYSAGFLTSTGLAEGCGLSVYGMLLIDHLFACWMRVQAPTVQCLTYVDDWQTVTLDPSYAVRQLDLVVQFAGMLDLTVDRKKTFGWSTCPEVRSTMRAAGISVSHHARELGGHFGISRQYTNRTLTQRFVDLEDFWTKLKQSQARYAAKVFMLRAVAWPRGLHAVASAPVGDQVWLNLRRKAVQALGWKRPGVNPSVLLGLVESAVDPQFLAALWTFRTARTHCPMDFWQTCVAPVANGDLDSPPNSLGSIALVRAHMLGLQVTRLGFVTDQFGPFCPYSCNPAEVDLRLHWAWQLVVAQKVQHRADFAGLWQADVTATRKALSALGSDDQAMYRFGLTGGLFTERYKAHWTDQSDACKWCGQVDTLRHRYWECPQHHDLRELHAPDLPALLDFVPPALSLRGWAILPPTWHDWIQVLVNLPSNPPQPAVPLCPGEWNDVFTDGSCLHQACPLYRCAAWSVTLASPYHAGWTPGGAAVVGAACLSGVCQTAYRAELYAVAYALHWAAACQAPVRIWTDCLGVLNRFQLLVWGSKKLNVNRSNSDLWAWILLSVESLGRSHVQLRKVPAHRALLSARSRHEVWMFAHNDYADRAARLANQARPTVFWEFWERHVQAAVAAEVIFGQVRNLHLAIGRRQVQSSVNVSGEPASAPVRQTREFTVQFVLGLGAGQPLPVTKRLYGPEMTQMLEQWFFARLAGDGQNAVWVSIAQLYLDFQLTWGHPGPLRINNQWVNADRRPYLAPEAFSFRLRVRWFRQFLKQYWKESQVTVAMEQCRPCSDLIHAYIPAASVPWDSRALQEVEQWLCSHLKMPCVRSADALVNLPLAVRCRSMAI